MKRALLLVLASCSGTATVDSGVPDSGGGTDAGPAFACVPSRCNAGGTWRVTYAGDAGSLLCLPVDDQILLTSDGGTVCMVSAIDGGSDGGCAFAFLVTFSRGADLWDLEIRDAGHLYGIWSTHVTSGSSSCDGRFDLHGIR